MTQQEISQIKHKQEEIKTILNSLALTGGLGFGALGLSQAIGKTLSTKDPKITINSVIDTIENPFNTVKDGENYFSDMINNLRYSIDELAESFLLYRITENYIKNSQIPISLEKKGIPQAPRSLCLKIKKLIEKDEKEAIKLYKKEVESKGMRCGCVQNYYLKNKTNHKLI